MDCNFSHASLDQILLGAFTKNAAGKGGIRIKTVPYSDDEYTGCNQDLGFDDYIRAISDITPNGEIYLRVMTAPAASGFATGCTAYATDAKMGIARLGIGLSTDGKPALRLLETA